MIDRRAFIGTLAGALIATPLAAQAQQAGKVWRVGLLDLAATSPGDSVRWKAFRERLRELGYGEGRNVVFDARWADGQIGRLPGLAIELVAAKVDILATASSEAALAAKQATGTIPIVMATGGDPVQLGLAASLARPGGNVTGVISLIRQLTGKRFEMLKQLVPRASRFALVRDPANRSSALSEREATSVKKSLDVAVQVVNVRSPKDLASAFEAMKRARIDAVVFAENTEYIAERRHIADLALLHRLPMMVAASEYAQAGALISYGTDYLDLFRRAASYVDKILKGSKPADLPVEQPTKFELVINLKTAKALSLTIPQSLLQRADEVIQE